MINKTTLNCDKVCVSLIVHVGRDEKQGVFILLILHSLSAFTRVLATLLEASDDGTVFLLRFLLDSCTDINNMR